MITHAWRERTEDGDVRLVRARKHGALWTLQSKLKADEHWTTHDPIEMADLIHLRDLIQRKYQRRRASFEDLQQIDDLIAQADPT